MLIPKCGPFGPMLLQLSLSLNKGLKVELGKAQKSMWPNDDAYVQYLKNVSYTNRLSHTFNKLTINLEYYV